MKIITPKESEESRFLLLENYTDMGIFFDHIEDKFKTENNTYDKMSNIKDEDTKSKLISHTCFNNPVALATAITASFVGYSPLVKSCAMMKLYKKYVQDDIEKSGCCIINSVGGMYPPEAYKKDEWIIKEDSYNMDWFKSNNCIYETNELLVLENDPVIDEYTIDLLGEFYNFPNNYSYIVNLRDTLATDEYEKYLRIGEFKKIFIYTTGLDNEQMYDYTERAINCGVKEFEWVFVEQSLHINKFIEWLNTLDITYDYQFEKSK